MLQRIKKCSERDSKWIIEIALKRSIRDDKRYTKNIFISLTESEWYFMYQPVSILLSANRFTERWRTFRYFLGKDHGKVSIRERWHGNILSTILVLSYFRELRDTIVCSNGVPCSLPAITTIVSIFLGFNVSHGSSPCICTSQVAKLPERYASERQETPFTLITSRLNSVFGGKTPLKPGVFDSLPFGTFPFVAPNVQRISTTV